MDDILKKLKQPAFLTCIAILFIAGLSQRAVVQALGVYLTKEAIPLQHPFDDLDESKLGPYRVVNKSKIENEDVIEQLGTEEYLQWMIEDTEQSDVSPTRYGQLFITYYTGNPDAVPHVPEECYTGAGNKPLGYYGMELNLRGEGPYIERLEGFEVVPDTLEIRQIAFGSQNAGIWNAGQKFSVLYFFKVNGQYTSNREETRLVLSSNFFSRYSYFCKVEWKFFGSAFGSQVFPNKAESIAASEKLMRVLLPVLEEDHWPNWEKINRKDAK